MDKYFFKISYNGTAYQGWQRQKQGLGIQEVLENTLSEIFKETIKIVGCGRTDSGVHAKNYYFHVFLPKLPIQLLFKLNKQLPNDVAIKNIFLVDEKAHAQRDASLRIYTYHLHFTKNPYLSDFSTWYPYGDLNFLEMKKAVALITKASDFKNFCLSPQKHKSTICRLQKVDLIVNPDKDKMEITFYGDHFLRSMIRLLMGEILQVGLGKTTLLELEGYLNGTLKKPRHHKAFPQGLHLSDVEYAYVDNDENSDLL